MEDGISTTSWLGLLRDDETYLKVYCSLPKRQKHSVRCYTQLVLARRDQTMVITVGHAAAPSQALLAFSHASGRTLMTFEHG